MAKKKNNNNNNANKKKKQQQQQQQQAAALAATSAAIEKEPPSAGGAAVAKKKKQQQTTTTTTTVDNNTTTTVNNNNGIIINNDDSSSSSSTSSNIMISEKIKRILLMVVIVIIAIIVKICIDLGVVFKDVVYNDSECKILTEIEPGSEDIVIINQNLAIVSSGDLNRIFFKSNTKPRESQLWAIQIINDDDDSNDNDNDKIITSKIEIEWDNNHHTEKSIKSTFGPHGLHYSNTTSRLYAVSHSCGIDVISPESTIEVFELIKENNNIKLIHETSIKSSKFLLGAINDVVEGASYGELYVTQWLPQAMPRNCLGSSDSIKDEFNMAMKMMFTHSTKVFRCAWSPKSGKTSSCNVVADNFMVANGITMNPTKTQVYVNDAGSDHLIYVYDRLPDNGKLKLKGKIPVSHGIDNIEYDMVSNKLTLSSTPFIYQGILKLLGVQNQIVAGGITTIELMSKEYQNKAKKVFDSNENDNNENENNENDNRYILEENVLLHDGTKLSMISSAVFFNNNKYILLGSPSSDGVLICPIPNNNNNKNNNNNNNKPTTTKTIKKGLLLK